VPWLQHINLSFSPSFEGLLRLYQHPEVDNQKSIFFFSLPIGDWNSRITSAVEAFCPPSPRPNMPISAQPIGVKSSRYHVKIVCPFSGCSYSTHTLTPNNSARVNNLKCVVYDPIVHSSTDLSIRQHVMGQHHEELDRMGIYQTLRDHQRKDGNWYELMWSVLSLVPVSDAGSTTPFPCPAFMITLPVSSDIRCNPETYAVNRTSGSRTPPGAPVQYKIAQSDERRSFQGITVSHQVQNTTQGSFLLHPTLQSQPTDRAYPSRYHIESFEDLYGCLRSPAMECYCDGCLQLLPQQ